MNRFSNWLFKNFFNLLIIPISILSVIFGMYSQIIDKEVRYTKPLESTTYSGFIDSEKELGPEEFKRISMKSLIKFFDTQIELNSITPIQNITLNKNPSGVYNNLIILDRTQSTLDKELDKSTDDFRRRIINNLKNSFKTEYFDPKNLSTKQLVVLGFYKLIKEIPGGYCLAFYDGDHKGLNYLKSNINRETLKWRDCNSNSSRIDLIERLSLEELTITKHNQQTNFLEIFSEIKKIDTTKFVVTIISDFNHELATIDQTAIEDLQKGNNRIIQFNIVYLPPSDPVLRNKSDELVAFLEDKFKGITNYVDINIKDNSNDLINNDTFSNFDNKNKQCLASFGFSSKGINLFYPKEDKVAKCRIKIEESLTNNQRAQWKISSKYPNSYDHNLFGYFKFSESEEGSSKFQVDGNWHKFSKEHNELLLNIALNSNIENNDLYFDIINGNITNRFDIRFVHFMPESVVILGKFSLLFLLFIYFGLIGSHLIINLKELRISNMITHPISYYIEELFLLSISFYVVFSVISDLQIFAQICYVILFSHLIVLGSYLFYNYKFR